MNERGSVTAWLTGLRVRDDAAARHLWEKYFRSLVRLARRRLGSRRAGPAASEDIALSAFDSCRRAVAAGRFPQLADRDDLWQVLVMLTARKTVDAIRHERAARRGGGGTAGASVADLISREPSPAFAAEFADQCRARLDRLGDQALRQIALWKLEGFSNKEVAERIGKSVATVERKVSLIRKKWEAGR